MGEFGISVASLKAMIGSRQAPYMFDVRRLDAFAESGVLLPTAQWRQHTDAEHWGRQLPADAHVVCYCVHGHGVSQTAAAVLRSLGVSAQFLIGGIEDWIEAGAVTINKAHLSTGDAAKPSRWVTRIQPKIDRIACPWLIKRFVDREAQFLFAEPDYAKSVAHELNATAFDIDDAALRHDGASCTFDMLLKHFAIKDPVLDKLAMIVRGADTARFELAPAAAGLLGISLGISHISGGDDHAALERGFDIYDALYAWQRFAVDETHSRPMQGAAA